MNYSKILLFALGIFLLSLLSSTILAFVFGETKAVESIFYYTTAHIMSFILSLLMYIYLAYNQGFKPYQHAIYVAILVWLISFIVSFLLYIFLGVPIQLVTFVVPFLLTIIEVLLGTLLGIQLRERRTLKENAI